MPVNAVDQINGLHRMVTKLETSAYQKEYGKDLIQILTISFGD